MNRVEKHLQESGMSYWQHLRHSITQSNRLIGIALKSYVHGVLPWLWASAGPLGIYKIYKEIRRMHHVQRLFDDDK
jgi:Family of unknown function (DUF6356)